MPDRYADADPDEIVTVLGLGSMSLRNAVRRCAPRKEEERGTAGVLLPLVARRVGKRPNAYDVNDFHKLAEMERFR